MSPRGYVSCLLQTCEWSETFDSPQVAVIAEVLHMVLKHPDEYHAATGKDPDVVKYDYRVEIKVLERRL